MSLDWVYVTYKAEFDGAICILVIPFNTMNCLWLGMKQWTITWFELKFDRNLTECLVTRPRLETGTPISKQKSSYKYLLFHLCLQGNNKRGPDTGNDIFFPHLSQFFIQSEAPPYKKIYSHVVLIHLEVQIITI